MGATDGVQADKRVLAKQAEALMEALYDESMSAAIKGDRERSDRLNAVAERAHARYQRRYYAFCGNQ